MKRWSLDARSRRRRKPQALCVNGLGGTMEQERCSRNARSQKTLVGRAQWKINQPPS